MLRTLRGVSPGAELRLSYVDVSMGLEQRRTRLAHWGFHCVCARCTSEEEDLEEEEEKAGARHGAKRRRT